MLFTISFILVLLGTSWIIGYTYRERGKLPHMTAMMIAMAIAMISSLLIGTLLGIFMKSNFILSSVYSMLAGIIIGYSAGVFICLIAALDGLLAGVMGGMMGAMMGVMAIEDPIWPYLIGFLDFLFVMVVLLLTQLIRETTQSSTSRFAKKPIFYLVPFVLLLVVLFVQTTDNSHSKGQMPSQHNLHQHHHGHE